jgi:hypothetical protein
MLNKPYLVTNKILNNTYTYVQCSLSIIYNKAPFELSFGFFNCLEAMEIFLVIQKSQSSNIDQDYFYF